MILLSIILFFTVLEAVHEGLSMHSKGAIAGVIEFIKLMGLTSLVIFWPWIVRDNQGLADYYSNPHTWHFWRYFVVNLVIGWVFIRYAIFDGIHNVAGKLGLYHIGTVKFYDRWMAKLFKDQYPEPSFWVPRLILLAVGLSLILKL